MKIIRVTEESEDLLYRYLIKFQGVIPYYFDTSKELLKQYLLHDTLKDHQLMKTNIIYIAVERGECVGMIQFGIQAVDISEKGEFLIQPITGNIRHLFYENESDVGIALVKKAMDYFEARNIDVVYAFNHVAGLSCYSKHGKLHESMNHIHELLITSQFNIRHENIYYILNIEDSKHLKEVTRNMEETFNLEIEHENDCDVIKLIEGHNNNKVVGISRVTKLSLWSMDKKDKKLYMRYIHINKEARGKGYSKKFIAKISEHYKQNGIELIHADTSLYNEVAQKLYEKLEFKNCGITRDYKFTRSCN